MIQEAVTEFLRDAQYRVGQLTAEIDELTNIGERELPKIKHGYRTELMAFIEVLYEINWSISDGYNHLYTTDDPEVFTGGWTEQEILDEIEYLRDRTSMNEMPLISFVPYTEEIITIISGGGGGGSGINITGTLRQMLMFNASGILVAIDVDPYVGMRPNETIEQYFNGRP